MNDVQPMQPLSGTDIEALIRAGVIEIEPAFRLLNPSLVDSLLESREIEERLAKLRRTFTTQDKVGRIASGGEDITRVAPWFWDALETQAAEVGLRVLAAKFFNATGREVRKDGQPAAAASESNALLWAGGIAAGFALLLAVVAVARR